MWDFYIAVAVYAITIQVGVVGNSWVVCTVLRNRRPYNSVTRNTPSDRLRNYIFVLAAVDFAVIITLLVRLLYLCLQKTVLETSTCQLIFFAEYFAKLASLSCVACISAERFIAIKKPFDSKVRKYLFKLTPYIAGCVLLVILIALVLQLTTVDTTTDRLECQLVTVLDGEQIFVKTLFVLVFLSLIVFVSANYGQIIRHVRRKFWKRKTRVCMDYHGGQQRVISEPRYMKEMTSAILRVAIFHIICWFPFCVFQVCPNEIATLTASSLRIFKKGKQDGSLLLNWVAFCVNWLVYANSAINWIFYAVMNRDLRTLIRRNTERRKRSNMSQASPPGRLSSSFRQFPSTFRFLHTSSTKSHSSGNDEKSSLHLAVPPTINGFNPSAKRKSRSEFDIRRGLLGKILTTPQPQSVASSKRNSILSEILVG